MAIVSSRIFLWRSLAGKMDCLWCLLNYLNYREQQKKVSLVVKNTTRFFGECKTVLD